MSSIALRPYAGRLLAAQGDGGYLLGLPVKIDMRGLYYRYRNVLSRRQLRPIRRTGIDMTPVGELIRYVVLAKLARGPAPAEEVEALVRAAVERTGLRFDWRIWPELLAKEVVIRDGVAELTERGRWLAAIGLKAVRDYVERRPWASTAR